MGLKSLRKQIARLMGNRLRKRADINDNQEVVMRSKLVLFLTVAVASVCFFGLSAPVMAEDPPSGDQGSLQEGEGTTTQPAKKKAEIKKKGATTQPAKKKKKKKADPWWTQPPDGYNDPFGNYKKCMEQLMRGVVVIHANGHAVQIGSDEDWVNHFTRALMICQIYLRERPTTTKAVATTQPATPAQPSS